MTFVLDQAIEIRYPSLAKLGRGPGLLLKPLLWIVGGIVYALRPDVRTSIAEQSRQDKLKKDKNDLYPLW